jgi:hypothetical protein
MLTEESYKHLSPTNKSTISCLAATHAQNLIDWNHHPSLEQLPWEPKIKRYAHTTSHSTHSSLRKKLQLFASCSIPAPEGPMGHPGSTHLKHGALGSDRIEIGMIPPTVARCCKLHGIQGVSCNGGTFYMGLSSRAHMGVLERWMHWTLWVCVGWYMVCQNVWATCPFVGGTHPMIEAFQVQATVQHTRIGNSILSLLCVYRQCIYSYT